MNFIAELSRRNVIRIAGLYAIVGWIILQVIATVAPMLGLPGWFGTAVLVFLLAGFPIIALGAWAFEMTPEGLKREEQLAPGEAPQPLRMMDVAILVGLVGVVGIGLWLSLSRAPSNEFTEAHVAAENQTEENNPTSIAVLAFEDLSEGGDQEYFADGISEEILNLLVRVDGLQVASRTSSFQYKNRPLGIDEIASELGVGHVLEGSVRRAGDRLRITAQLIDARTDRHLWSENFDRDLTDIFEIQDEIANAIVAALADSLGLAPDNANVEVQAITENLSAYDAYLEGRALFLARNGLERAIQLLERAVELDPDFAEAWETLASTYVVTPAWGIEGRPYLELAQSAAERAIAIDDSRADAYAVQAAVIMNGGGHLAAARPFFEDALERDPRNITALDWYSANLFYFGYIQRGEELVQQCLRVDPLYTKCRNTLVSVYIAQGRNEEALVEARRVIAEGYANLAVGIFEAYLNAGLRDQSMLMLGQAIGTGAPIGATIDAILDPQSHNVNDAYAQLQSYAEANPDEISAAELYYLGVRMGADNMSEVTLDDLSMMAWQPYLADARRSEAFRGAVREFGVYDFWRETGFPDLCRPVGEDDFECD